MVIADKDVQRLKGMVKEERGKLLKGRARKPLEQMNLGQFEESDDVDGERDEEGIGGITCSGRLYKGMSRKRRGGSIVTLSKEKLLQSSLTSLESLGRQRRCGVPLGSGGHDAELLPTGALYNTVLSVLFCPYYIVLYFRLLDTSGMLSLHSDALQCRVSTFQILN